MNKKWKTYEPNFEFSEDLQDYMSAWRGHLRFSYDLIRNTQPETVVELGTHYGHSFFSMLQAVKDADFSTEVHAVDSWEGDKHAGKIGEEDYDKKNISSVFKTVKTVSEKYYNYQKYKLHRMFFEEANRNFNEHSVDILHIDGLHTYEAVKNDFETWLPKMKKNGIMLFHDIAETRDDFGVNIFWDEVKQKYPTLSFTHSHGLGVLFLDKDFDTNFLESIIISTNSYYNKLFISSENERLLDAKDNHITNLEATIIDREITLAQMQNAIIENQPKLSHFERLQKTRNWSLWEKIFKVEDKIRPLLRKYIKKPIEKLNTFRKVNSYLGTSHAIKYLGNRVGLNDFIIDPTQVQFYDFIKQVESKEIEYVTSQKFNENIKFSFLVPVYNVLPWLLEEAVNSVKNQSYSNWEICLYDDASTNKDTLKKLAEYKNLNDDRIKVRFGKENGHISHSTNQALDMATGDYSLLLDNDDTYAPHALASIKLLLDRKPDTDVIYYDEDKLDFGGNRISPIFKPQFSPETLTATMYLAHCCIRTSLFKQVGGMRKGYEGSQDYDLTLRLSEVTKNIEHIPFILYHWRMIQGSTSVTYDSKSYTKTAASKGIQDHVNKSGFNAEVVGGLTDPSFRAKYEIKSSPLVSIIIPTHNLHEDLKICIQSIEEKTTYPHYEIIIVNNNSNDPETISYLETIREKYRVISYPHAFNYSLINNFAADQANGEYLLLLNNDTEVINKGWLTAMLEVAQLPEVGCVGALLYYPDNTIQHAGVTIGVNGIAAHQYKYRKIEELAMLDFPRVIHNVSAVTAACLMVKKSIYNEVNGLDPVFQVAFNDIDFCLRVGKAGYRNVYTPFAQLYHFESKSRGSDDLDPLKKVRFANEVRTFKDRWNEILTSGDPYYNPNLSLERVDFSLNMQKLSTYKN